MKELLDRYAFSYEEERKDEEDKARCGTCEYFEEGICGLYKKLNELMSDCFELTEVVSKDGHCKAFVPMGKSFKSMKRKADLRRRELNESEERYGEDEDSEESGEEE